MSGDLESRLERQLSARAASIPQKDDQLQAVRATGRRRQLRSRVAGASVGLIGLLAIGGVATQLANNQPETTYTVSDDPAEQPESVEPNPTADPDADATDESDGPESPADPEAESSESEGDSTDSETGSDSEAPSDDDSEVTSVDGLAQIGDFDYLGAFRLSSETFGVSDTNYAVGTLAHNPANNSLFIAGHSQHGAIAEFDIPAFGNADQLGDLPIVEQPRQPFVSLFDRVDNPDAIDRVTGMYVVDGRLLINAENWFDAAAEAQDTTLVIEDADALDGAITDFHQMDGRAVAAGYVSPVPDEWRSAVGGSALTGWASNYSIVSRYSVGPSLYGFSPEAVVGAPAAGPIDTVEHMAFPHSGEVYLSPDATEETTANGSALWNILSRGVYGFIVPDTRTFAVVGSSGGVDSGIGYQITQDDGVVCDGLCSVAVADNYNHYWLFDLDEILGANNSSDPRPYAHGRWSVPFDDGGQHLIVGGTLDPASNTLYLSLAEAGQVGEFDRPPVIVAYNVG